MRSLNGVVPVQIFVIESSRVKECKRGKILERQFRVAIDNERERYCLKIASLNWMNEYEGMKHRPALANVIKTSLIHSLYAAAPALMKFISFCARPRNYTNTLHC